MTLGCTVGVVRLCGGFLFFKNRDLRREFVKHRILVYEASPDVYALRGVNLKTKALEGISIGANSHRVCAATTHVQSSDDRSYDLLCERLLLDVRRPEDVRGTVERFMSGGPAQGGRILVALPETAYLIEVFREESRLEEIRESFAITNTFSLIDHRAEQPEIRDWSSTNRLAVATEAISRIRHVGALKSLLRSHVPEKGPLSICRHDPEDLSTESSHIIQVHGNRVGWNSLAGSPCENDYDTVQLFQ